MRHLIAAVLLLALASALALLLVPRFEVVQASAVEDPSFATLDRPEGAPVWIRVGDGQVEPVANGVRIVNGDHGTLAGLDQVIPIAPGARAFRVSATIELENVEPGPQNWQQARVVLLAVPPGARYVLNGPRQLFERAGDFGPRRQSAIFWVDPAHGEARLLIRLQHATGVMTVQDLEVEALAKPPARVLLRQALISTWLAVAAGIALVLWWQSDNRAAATLVLAGLGLMAGVMIMPHGVRQPLQDFLNTFAADERLDMFKPFLHLLGFGTLALLSRLALPRLPLWLFVSGWISAALLLELAELWFRLFDPGDWIDMAGNVSGAIMGLTLAGRWLEAGRGQPAAAP